MTASQPSRLESTAAHAVIYVILQKFLRATMEISGILEGAI
jgi:hypothetical protein